MEVDFYNVNFYFCKYISLIQQLYNSCSISRYDFLNFILIILIL